MAIFRFVSNYKIPNRDLFQLAIRALFNRQFIKFYQISMDIIDTSIATENVKNWIGKPGSKINV